MRNGRGILAIVLWAGVFFALHALVTGPLRVRAEYGESNFQSNMIRLTRYFSGPPPKVVLAGSSLSGRVLAQYFPAEIGPVANLGLDGLRAETAATITLRNEAFRGWLLIETANLGTALSPNDGEVVRELGGWTFRLSRYVSFLRAESRPSAILYTRMKMAREAGPGAPTSDFGRVVSGASFSPKPGVQPGVSVSRAPALLRLISDARARGLRVALVRLPSGGAPQSVAGREGEFGDWLAAEAGVPFIDVPDLFASVGLGVSYTDGMHMRGESARSAAGAIAAAIRELDRRSR